eukprot:CAMPEP_0184361820 /NCGR_PEP_ID=MMETSP1089-20130417/132051_1 /TAXON_ID=38269 ORGANISM="Gloeochaete wittrockiana, Strain SAG46.84" /NCGR_SAMPLE_ID=MMETSP1089 /ASSEMBLY_ACC=CAM_ASM_000445 /LENGTH=119 /DNA_ID=CAMNT_0026701635 /DNA_START=279 /DNA_END=634 /DNA_ORIENTATION=+
MTSIVVFLLSSLVAGVAIAGLCPALPDYGVYPSGDCARLEPTSSPKVPCNGLWPRNVLGYWFYPNDYGKYPDHHGCYPDINSKYPNNCNPPIYPDVNGLYPPKCRTQTPTPTPTSTPTP